MSGRFLSPKPRKSRYTPENERLVHETSMTLGSKRLVFQGVQYWQYPELFGGHDGNWWVFKSGRKPLNCKYTRLNWASLKTNGKSPLKINGWKMNLCISRWWFQTFFIFTPIPGEMIQFDYHIFQMGWNHQPEIAFSCQGVLGWVFLTSCGEPPCNLEENSWFSTGVPRQVWAVNMTQVEGPKRGGGSGSELAGGFWGLVGCFQK